MGLNIGLVYDLRKDYLALGYSQEQVGEFDSDETLSLLEEAIRSLGHRTERIGHARALCARLVAGDRWDLVFNIAEGLWGRAREAQAPCLLELYGIAYTFSDPLVCAMTLDKAMAKRLVLAAGLPTPAFAVVEKLQDVEGVALEYPLFVKPLAEGTGKGISDRSLVASPAELADLCGELLERFAQPVLVEEYLPGRELTVGLLGTGRGARVLGTMEIQVRRHAGQAIYSFEKKERCAQLISYLPLAAGALRAEAESLALAAYRALECRDAARVDFRCDARGRPNFLEVNPLPGLHPTHSDLPMIAAQAGLSYAQLIEAIIAGALERGGVSRDRYAVARVGAV